MAKTTRMSGTFSSEDIEVRGVLCRRCNFCGEVLPLTEEYFSKNGVVDGVVQHRKDCKRCYNIRRKVNKSKRKHSTFLGHQRYRGETDVEFTLEDWKNCLIFFGGTCAFCGAQPRKGQHLSKDHLQPMVDGGTTTPSNIVPACRSCNSSKCDEEFKQWYMKQDFFSQARLNRIFEWRTIMRQVENEESD